MKRKNYPREAAAAEGAADGGIPAELAYSQYQSNCERRMLSESHLRQSANTFIKKGGSIL